MKKLRLPHSSRLENALLATFTRGTGFLQIELRDGTFARVRAYEFREKTSSFSVNVVSRSPTLEDGGRWKYSPQHKLCRMIIFLEKPVTIPVVRAARPPKKKVSRLPNWVCRKIRLRREKKGKFMQPVKAIA